MEPQTLPRGLTLHYLLPRPSYLKVAGDNCEMQWGADKEKKTVFNRSTHQHLLGKDRQLTPTACECKRKMHERWQ